MRRGEVTWQYGTKVNDKRRVRCNFYNNEMGGRIYRLKEYIAWVKGNVTDCKEVSSKRETDAAEVGRGYESPIDEDEDEEAQFEVQMERTRIASFQELNYRQMEIQEMYGRRDGTSDSRQPQQPIIPGRGGCGHSLLRSTSSRLRRSFSSRPSSYSRLSTTQRHEPIDVLLMTRKPSGLDPHNIIKRK
ncbi:hypothetical protein AMTRI_Chr09g16100 [Amborella trichopoda]